MVQGFVKTTWPESSLSSSSTSLWKKLYLSSCLLWRSLDPLSAAVRISVTPRGTITTLHSFMVPEFSKERMQQVLAAYLRTDGVASGHTDVPYEMGEITRDFIRPDDDRFQLEYETLETADGFNLFYNVNLFDLLVETFLDAQAHGVALAYECLVTPWRPEKSFLREALYKINNLHDSTGLPEEIRKDQLILSDRIKKAAYVVSECYSVSDNDDPAWIRSAIQKRLADTLYGHFGAPPRIVSMDSDDAEAFAMYTHPYLLYGWPEKLPLNLISQAADQQTAERRLSGSPLIGVENPREYVSVDVGFLKQVTTLEDASMRGTPIIEKPARPFLFVSYARHDKETVYRLMEQLQGAGISLWFDREIAGGDEWDIELENRIMECAGILAFISPTSISSKYCRREIKFADALEKVIFPIYVEKSPLGHGLLFLLRSFQFLDINSGDFLPSLCKAIEKHSPSALSN